jgi:hypothetical protein
MSTTPPPSSAEHGRPGEAAAPERAMAPIRWPRPNGPTLGLIGLWVVGVIIALFVPALIVAPGAKSPPAGDVAWAFTTTVVGAAVMLLASFGLWRRTGEAGVTVMGAVPAAACVAGGIILAATKLAG